MVAGKKNGSVVVVAEDEEDSRDALREVLEHEGYRVEVAKNGAEALERLDALGSRVRVMLLDLFMPVMDGWRVLERLRATGRIAEVHVVVTTSAPQSAPAGVPVLSKPLDLAKVLRTVKAYYTNGIA